MGRKIYVATVQLIIEADHEHRAQDVVDSILSPYAMANGTLVEWNYLEIGKHSLIPARIYGYKDE